LGKISSIVCPLKNEAWNVFMKRWTLGVIFVIFCIIAFSLVLIVPILNPPETDSRIGLDLSEPIEKAIDFFEDSNEPYVLLWLNVIYRRFRIIEFADALERYDQLLAKQPQNAPLLRLFRRIADHDNQLYVQDLAAVSSEVDLITIPALYCDQLALPNDYPEMLERAVGLGDYQLTHVILALIWIQENGCELVLPDGFIRNVYFANAALIKDDPVVDDLKLEAAAFLYLAGQGALVDDSFIESVVASQNDDGGWGLSSDFQEDSEWHPTVLGLLLLLHKEFPSDSYPPMLDPASP
jgi:hypothetical protein